MESYRMVAAMVREINCSAFIRGGQDRLWLAHFSMATTMICPLKIGFVGYGPRAEFES